MTADMEMLKGYSKGKLVRVRTALTALRPYTQEQVGVLVKTCAKAIFDHVKELAGDIAEEIRTGIYEDKVAKDRGKARVIWWSPKGKKSVGVIDVDEASGITKVAKPVGVVGVITPTTSPIVICMSNSIFALKYQNPIIITPHPRAVGCCIKTMEYMNINLKALGAPDHYIQILDIKSLDLTKMLAASMDVIIATDDMDMVRSVYSSGKSALGVGTGNAWALVNQGYSLETTIPQIITGRGFDSGIICTGEQAVHLYRGDYDHALETINWSGAHAVPKGKAGIVRDFLLLSDVVNRDVVDQDAVLIAEKCDISVPDRARVLAMQADGIDDILGMEKMPPVIILYAYDTWEKVVKQAKNNLNKVSKGHNTAMHSTSRRKIEYATLRTEVSRIVCNQTRATGGGGSFQDGLNPTNALGCDSWGNGSIPENLTYYHLMSTPRIAQYMPDHATPSDKEIQAWWRGRALNWQEEYKRRLCSTEETVQHIHSEDTVLLGHAVAGSSLLVDAMIQNATAYQDVRIVHMTNLGNGVHIQPGMESHFHVGPFFLGATVRVAVAEGRGDFTPCFFHEIPQLIRERQVPYDVLVTQVSPSDEKGYYSLGVSADYTYQALKNTRTVTTHVNDQYPYTFGAKAHMVKLDYTVEQSAPLCGSKLPRIGEAEGKIGHYYVSLIRDGATFQLGIGAIPDAVMMLLGDKHDLGIHPEMISDDTMELYQKGAITNQRKNLDRGKMTIIFAMGTRKLYQFLDKNPDVLVKPVDYASHPVTTMKERDMISINSAAQVDLQGRVDAEAIGLRQFFGVGGQVDSICGTAMGGDASAIAMPSAVQKKDRTLILKIVPFLGQGAPVTTSRNDVDYIITKYDITHLKGETLQDRVWALISISHSSVRDSLAEGSERRFRQNYRAQERGDRQ